LPAVTVDGVILETTGAGLLFGGGVEELEEPPPQPEIRKNTNKQVNKAHLEGFIFALERLGFDQSLRN
jgi:hypothetical protein